MVFDLEMRAMVIRPERHLARRVRSFYGAAGWLLLALGCFVAPFAWVAGGGKMAPLALSVGAFVIGAGWWARLYSAAVPERMVLEGERLRIVWADGRRELVPLSDAIRCGQGMLLGRRWLPFYAKFRGKRRQPLYAAEEIGPLLVRVPERTGFGFFLEGLARAAPVCWAQTLMWAGGFAAIAARISVVG